MSESGHNVPSADSGGPSSSVYAALIAIGLVAPAVTFWIAVSDLESNTKIYGLAAIAFVYFLICFWSYRQLRAEVLSKRIDARQDALHGKLLALEEANEFFGTSLKPADTFRLVSSRIRDIYPFSSSVFFLTDGAQLKAVHADGLNQAALLASSVEKGQGLAGLALLSGEVEYSPDLNPDRPVFDAAALRGLNSSVAVPLSYKQAVFGVVQLFGDRKLPGDERYLNILRAVGERIAPLLRGSIAFGESLSNALTDSLTKLPNERAFYMVLENQLGESQRLRDERPLAVIALDISSFDDEEHGFSGVESERVVGFAGEVIRAQLRKMDFLARSINDEFLLILPTANDATAREIMNRIMLAFAARPFTTAGGDEIKLEINFGCACFWQDGETAPQLLQNARLRKQQAKAEEPKNILRFPKEYVN